MWVRVARVLRCVGVLLLVMLMALTHIDMQNTISVSENIEYDRQEDNKSNRLWFMRGGGLRPSITDAREARLFPEDAPGEDRLVDQLMYTLPPDEDVPTKTILLVENFKIWGVPPGKTEFLRNKCPVYQCTLISDPRNIKTADVLIFKNELEYNGVRRPHQVAWFVSNCFLHSPRFKYARQLAKHIPVDIYGLCGNDTCPRGDPKCLEMLSRDYKFYLAFENGNCRDYITEKFFDNGLKQDVLPVVMGARPSEYAAIAPKNSFIHVDEFAGPEELAAYLHRLDKDDELYNSYFKWKGTGEFVDTFFFCRVCAMAHANDRRQRHAYYEDLKTWWDAEDTCTSSQWRDNTD